MENYYSIPYNGFTYYAEWKNTHRQETKILHNLFWPDGSVTVYPYLDNNTFPSVNEVYNYIESLLEVKDEKNI